MSPADELFQIAARLDAASKPPLLTAAESALAGLEQSASDAARAFCGSWLGYHARVYYSDLCPPPPGANFSQEWGLKDLSFSSMGSQGDWREFETTSLIAYLRDRVGNPDLSEITGLARETERTFDQAKAETRSLLLTENQDGADKFLTQLLADLDALEPVSPSDVAQIWSPKGRVFTRDMLAAGQGTQVPAHIAIKAETASIRQAFSICAEASRIARKAASHMQRQARQSRQDARVGTNVFIGHGRSGVWRELKDFVQERLHLPWDEFNRVPVAGVTNQARLAEMLDAAAVAFVIMTAEDETAEGSMQARMNVIHEVGLFQGRLGFTKAIVLLEQGCEEFSNIQGLGQIRFPAGRISASFEDVRLVLEREGVLSG